MLGILSGTGLAWAAGLNAYIPALVTALLARFTDVVVLPDGFSFLESWWAISALVVLLIIEEVLDKVPVVDHANDVIQTAIRPASGALVFGAGSQSALDDHVWVALLAGSCIAFVVHTVKALARAAINTGTGGVGAPVASVAEDIVSVITSFIALLVPILVIAMIAGSTWLALATRRRRRQRDSRQSL